MIPKQITFRLTSDEAKQLYLAAREEKVSSHLKARDIVLEGLTIQKIESVLVQLLETVDDIQHTQSVLEQEIEANRWGMIETLAVIVANQEKVSRENAREWIRDQFESTRGRD